MTVTIIRPGQHVYTVNGPQVIAPRGAAVPGWWEEGGATGAVAVYQPKGAASLAASYTDLSGNGNDAAPGVAPTWDGVNGWIFNGTTQYLKTPNQVTDQTISFTVQFTNGASGYFVGVGGAAGANRAYLRLVGGINVRYRVNATTLIPPAKTSGNLAITTTAAGGIGYRDGISEGAVGAAWAGQTAGTWCAIGSTYGLFGYCAARVQAFAYYDNTLTAPQVLAVSTAMAAL